MDKRKAKRRESSVLPLSCFSHSSSSAISCFETAKERETTNQILRVLRRLQLNRRLSDRPRSMADN